MKNCPACGQPISAKRFPVEALTAIALSTIRRTIIRNLVDRYPLGMSADGLLFAIYGGSHEPENARNALSVQLNKIRRILALYGWTISKGVGGRGNPVLFKLEPLP